MTKYVTEYMFFLLCLLAFTACTPQDDRLEYALKQAGDNRTELEKVLNRYRDSDKEKYRAACYLIRNMPFYSSYEGKELEKYLRYYQAYYANKNIMAAVADSIKRADGEFSMSLLTKRKDIETVDSAFLTTHIDWAFKVRREQPWGRNVTFDDFCEYILPYRMLDEPLSLWRKELYEQYNPLLDSLRATSSADDPLQAAQVVLTHMRKQKYMFTSSFPVGPHVGPDILRWRVGICRDFVDGLTYVCRALGIPCGSDRIMVWSDTNNGHSWCFTLDKEGRNYAMNFPYDKYWKPCKEYSPYRKGKVYRTLFQLDEESMKRKQQIQNLHPTFRSPFFRDVTTIYLNNTVQTMEIPENRLLRQPEKGETVYLCLPDKQTWVPIDYTLYQGKNISFQPVEGNFISLAAVWDQGILTPISQPFHIDSTLSEMHIYKPEAKKQIVNLTMKYHQQAHDYLHTRMLGGVIEGSSTEDFRETDTLYTITRTPYRLYSVAHLKTDKAYRYIRYRGVKGSHCNIAELSLYRHADDTRPLRGRPIYASDYNRKDGQYKYTNVFDGDDETSYDYAGDSIGWVGLDFGRPVRVEKAVYTPRNRVNFIYKGYDYELFYWGDGHWNTLGRQTATADSLVYEAPVNALLYLKCYTAGKDERIFEYKDGKQIFR